MQSTPRGPSPRDWHTPLFDCWHIDLSESNIPILHLHRSGPRILHTCYHPRSCFQPYIHCHTPLNSVSCTLTLTIAHVALATDQVWTSAPPEQTFTNDSGTDIRAFVNEFLVQFSSKITELKVRAHSHNLCFLIACAVSILDNVSRTSIPRPYR